MLVDRDQGRSGLGGVLAEPVAGGGVFQHTERDQVTALERQLWNEHHDLKPGEPIRDRSWVDLARRLRKRWIAPSLHAHRAGPTSSGRPILNPRSSGFLPGSTIAGRQFRI